MNAADVNRSTNPLMSRNIAVSFRRLGQSPNVMLAARRWDDFCRAKQLRAECQPGGLGSLEVDAQADLALIEDKSNDSAAPVEIIAVADGEDRLALERRENAIQALGFRPADEEDVALPDILHTTVTVNPEGS